MWVHIPTLLLDVGCDLPTDWDMSSSMCDDLCTKLNKQNTSVHLTIQSEYAANVAVFCGVKVRVQLLHHKIDAAANAVIASSLLSMRAQRGNGIRVHIATLIRCQQTFM